MKTLDDVVSMKTLDPSDVLGSTALFPDQCRQAWSESSVIKFPGTYNHIQNVIVCGMGGSRFTPKTVKELYKDRITKPYEIIEDYSLPAYAGKDTLVILSSFSGSTEEIVSCCEDAFKRGAMVTAVVQGGTIGEILTKKNIPAYIFRPEYNPCGQPRIGGGYLLMGHMGILYALGLLTLDPEEVTNAITYVRSVGLKYKAEIPTRNNTAKQLAMRLIDTHPFIVTAAFLRGFGNGFANQINETAKMISDYRYIPELNHHLMEGLKHPDTLRQNGLFVFFLSDLYSREIQKRFEITEEIVKKQQIAVQTVKLYGRTPLQQVLEAYTVSGFTTFYMAMLYDCDPVAIPWVNYFKEKLAKS
jgi:glucose/mannose-6-phosphate isomerase